MVEPHLGLLLNGVIRLLPRSASQVGPLLAALTQVVDSSLVECVVNDVCLSSLSRLIGWNVEWNEPEIIPALERLLNHGQETAVHFDGRNRVADFFATRIPVLLSIRFRYWEIRQHFRLEFPLLTRLAMETDLPGMPLAFHQF